MITGCSSDAPLALRSISTATTYNFTDGLLGWACCTVNDATGDLAITSDWGNYAFRWNVKHLGCPTLTEFISEGSIEYLADKLTNRSERERFDAEGTVAAFRELLRKSRREAKIYGDDFACGIYVAAMAGRR